MRGGIAPTGKPFTVTGTTTNRIEGGQIAEAWGSIDLLGLMLQLGLVTPPGTVAFFQTIVPPEAALAEVDREAMLREIAEKWPSLLTVADPSRGPGMHRTETLDLLTVVSGEVWLVLEEGEVHLRAGDCVVQRGTWHAWRNRSAAPCVLAGVMIGSGEQTTD